MTKNTNDGNDLDRIEVIPTAPPSTSTSPIPPAGETEASEIEQEKLRRQEEDARLIPNKRVIPFDPEDLEFPKDVLKSDPNNPDALRLLQKEALPLRSDAEVKKAGALPPLPEYLSFLADEGQPFQWENMPPPGNNPDARNVRPSIYLAPRREGRQERLTRRAGAWVSRGAVSDTASPLVDLEKRSLLDQSLEQSYQYMVDLEIDFPIDKGRMLECMRAQAAGDINGAVAHFIATLGIDDEIARRKQTDSGRLGTLATIPAGFLSLLPNLLTIPNFVGLQEKSPIAAAAVNFALQLILAGYAEPRINAYLQIFFVNYMELVSSGGVANREANLAKAPKYPEVQADLEGAAVLAAEAMTALENFKNEFPPITDDGPQNLDEAQALSQEAHQKIKKGADDLKQRELMNQTNIAGQEKQSHVRMARNTGYTLVAPFAGKFISSDYFKRLKKFKEAAYVTHVLTTMGAWGGAFWAGGEDDPKKRHESLKAIVATTDFRTKDAIKSNAPVADLTEDDIDIAKVQSQWHGYTKPREKQVGVIIDHRIRETEKQIANVYGLSEKEWKAYGELSSKIIGRATADEEVQLRIFRSTDVALTDGDFAQWKALEIKTKQPLDADAMKQLATLEAKAKSRSNTMSRAMWAELGTLLEPSAALTPDENDKLAKLQKRAATSLSAADQKRLETFRIAKGATPSEEVVSKRAMLEEAAEFLAEQSVEQSNATYEMFMQKYARKDGKEGHVFNEFNDIAIYTNAGLIQLESEEDEEVRSEVDIDNLFEENVEQEIEPLNDIDAAGNEEMRRSIDNKVNNSPLTADQRSEYLDVRSKSVIGLTAKELSVLARLKGKMKAVSEENQDKLKAATEALKTFKQDKANLKNNWPALSDDAKVLLCTALKGGIWNDMSIAWAAARAKASLAEEWRPQLAQRYGANWQMGIGGKSMSFIAGAAFKLAKAFGEKYDVEKMLRNRGFYAIKLPVYGVLFGIGAMASYGQPTMINDKVDQRDEARETAAKGEPPRSLIAMIHQAAWALLRNRSQVLGAQEALLAAQAADAALLAVEVTRGRTETRVDMMEVDLVPSATDREVLVTAQSSDNDELDMAGIHTLDAIQRCKTIIEEKIKARHPDVKRVKIEPSQDGVLKCMVEHVDDLHETVFMSHYHEGATQKQERQVAALNRFQTGDRKFTEKDEKGNTIIYNLKISGNKQVEDVALARGSSVGSNNKPESSRPKKGPHV